MNHKKKQVRLVRKTGGMIDGNGGIRKVSRYVLQSGDQVIDHAYDIDTLLDLYDGVYDIRIQPGILPPNLNGTQGRYLKWYGSVLAGQSTPTLRACYDPRTRELATHNVPCPVCFDRPASYDTMDERFQPCPDCDVRGWELVNRNTKARQTRKREWAFLASVVIIGMITSACINLFVK